MTEKDTESTAREKDVEPWLSKIFSETIKQIEETIQELSEKKHLPKKE